MPPRTQRFLWSLPQPLIAFGFAALAGSAYITKWMDPGLLVSILLWSIIPLMLLLERLAPRRREWLLDRRDLAIDTFWVLGTFLIWVPLYDTYYDTPISDAFKAIRAASGFPYQLEAHSVAGLLLMAVIARLAIELISYWAHRLQHRFLFLWRIHATHHHITKMSVGRTDRTHPLEFIGLNLGSAVVLAFLGASDAVVGTSLVFASTSAHLNHSNLPFTSGAYGWIFTTAEQHLLHHSRNYAESNRNFGCVVILWDRVFGTFSGKPGVDGVGNGTGRRLTLVEQLRIPFRSNSVLRNL